MNKINRVCIFCASSPGIKKKYFDIADELARILVKNNIAINYGGGGVGLMGRIADVALANGGSIRGYIPVFMNQMKWAHEKVTEMILVDNMHERKYRLRKDADAIIALPGGVGTLEELLEVITLKQLGQFNKPIVILNTDGFYDPILELMERMVEEHFMRDIHRKIWSIANHPSEILDAISNAHPWDEGAIKYAAVGNHRKDKGGDKSFI
jgi:hypothetical protein